MSNFPSSPFHGLGSLLQLAGAVVSFALGFTEIAFLACVLIGGLIFQISYILIRLPQIVGFCGRDGIKIVKLFALQMFTYCLLASVLWGIGKGISLAF
jgi:hypothetical protein